MICKFCGEEFTPKLKHPGYINVCLEEDCRGRTYEGPKPIRDVSEVSLQMKVKVKIAGQDDGSYLDYENGIDGRFQ